MVNLIWLFFIVAGFIVAAFQGNIDVVTKAVFVMDGQADLVVERESYENIVGNDVIPERLQKAYSKTL